MSAIELVGVQTPRILTAPPRVSSSGVEAIELARAAGLYLDPWQELTVTEILGEREDGKWAAREAGVCVPRQNGKGGIIETIELAGLFLLGELLQTHSAHLFPTALEAFRRLCALIEGSDDLSRRVRRISNSHGEEGIELHGPPGARITGAQRIRFQARSKGAGRGFTGNRTIFDEAMDLPDTVIGNMKPTMSAVANPQTLYFGSAVDEEIHPDGQVFARVRARGLSGTDPSLVYIEFSAPFDDPEHLTLAAAMDPEIWAIANPAYGIRIFDEAIMDEHRSMSSRSYAVERLGVGKWPVIDDDSSAIVDLEVWDELEDRESESLDGQIRFAIDVSPDRSRASIAVAGMREDGTYHLEVIDRREGTDWLPERCAKLDLRWSPISWHADERGPVASVLPAIAEEGVEVETMTGADVAKACGFYVDIVAQRAARHVGQPELRNAIRGAEKRPLGDAFAFSRRKSTADISPLMAVAFALWGWGSDEGGGGFEAWT